MYLVDTNVLSEFRKLGDARVDRNVAAWAERVGLGDLFVSVVTLHELEVGILRMERRDPLQGDRLRRWYEFQVLAAYEGRILVIDGAIARRAADLQVPDPMPLADSLIAATALVHGLTVATRNTADFAASGAAVVNPWKWTETP